MFLPVSWDTVLKLGQLGLQKVGHDWATEQQHKNNPTVASKCSSESKTHTSFTLNQKLEVIMLSEECRSKAEVGWKLGFLCQLVSQDVNAKEKFLQEIRGASLVNTQMIKWYCWYGESFSGLDGRLNQPQYSFKLKPNPQQCLNSLQFYKGWVMRKLQKKSSKLAEVVSWCLRNEAISIT